MTKQPSHRSLAKSSLIWTLRRLRGIGRVKFCGVSSATGEVALRAKQIKDRAMNLCGHQGNANSTPII